MGGRGGKAMKRKTPYQMLLETAREWAWDAAHPHERPMFTYYKKHLDSGYYELRGLYERTKAADALGYDVYVEADDTGLHMRYRKRIPPMPMWLK